MGSRPLIELIRFAETPTATLGVLTGLGLARPLYTVERPWLENLPFVSCIPLGRYLCRSRFFNRGGYQSLGVLDVPGRSDILFHCANRGSDVEGCIGVGMRPGSGLDIEGSREALKLFLDLVDGRECDLVVRRRRNYLGFNL